MGKAKHGMLIALEKNVEILAGKKISKKVMEGSEEITEKTNKRKIAEWVKNVGIEVIWRCFAFISFYLELLESTIQTITP